MDYDTVIMAQFRMLFAAANITRAHATIDAYAAINAVRQNGQQDAQLYGESVFFECLAEIDEQLDIIGQLGTNISPMASTHDEQKAKQSIKVEIDPVLAARRNFEDND